MFDDLYAFKAQSGHCDVSTNDERNKSLGQWVSTQRVSYKKNTLRSDRIQQLSSIGFIWDLLEHAWNEKFDQLCAFKGRSDHCNVSRNDERNKSLGQWVNAQRVSYKKSSLKSDHIQQLISIGVIWDLLEHAWNTNFDQLCAFKGQSGHCNVSTNDERNKSLGQW
eukprot:12966008-Ditylum_brightwellii.AAC.1